MSALNFNRVGLPRIHYSLEWQRINLTSGHAEPSVELWPSVLPPGQVAYLGSYGSIVADQNADGSRLAVRDLATPAHINVWDQTGKRILGFLPYGPNIPVEAVVWVADNRLITRGGGKVTGWEIPGPKAVFEVTGYAAAHVLSPGRKWIALQSEKYLDFYETATGKPLGRLERSHPDGKAWQGFAVSRDGMQLAALVSAGSSYEWPAVWAVATWDLKTGKTQGSWRILGGSGKKTAQNPMWLGPHQLLTGGGGDVIDLDVRIVTATLGLAMSFPLPSPDGRYWAAEAIGRRRPANRCCRSQRSPQAIRTNWSACYRR